jgi:hypothetical protein
MNSPCSTQTVGLLFLLMAVIYMIFCFVVGRSCPEKIDPRTIVLVGFFFNSMGLAFVAPIPLFPKQSLVCLLSGLTSLGTSTIPTPPSPDRNRIRVLRRSFSSVNSRNREASRRYIRVDGRTHELFSSIWE